MKVVLLKREVCTCDGAESMCIGRSMRQGWGRLPVAREHDPMTGRQPMPTPEQMRREVDEKLRYLRFKEEL